MSASAKSKSSPSHPTNRIPTWIYNLTRRGFFSSHQSCPLSLFLGHLLCRACRAFAVCCCLFCSLLNTYSSFYTSIGTLERNSVSREDHLNQWWALYSLKSLLTLHLFLNSRRNGLAKQKTMLPIGPVNQTLSNYRIVGLQSQLLSIIWKDTLCNILPLLRLSGIRCPKPPPNVLEVCDKVGLGFGFILHLHFLVLAWQVYRI